MTILDFIPTNNCDFNDKDIRQMIIADCLMKRGYWLTSWKAVQTNRDCEDFYFSFQSMFKNGYHYAFAIKEEDVLEVLKEFEKKGYYIYKQKCTDYIRYGFVHGKTEMDREDNVEWFS